MSLFAAGIDDQMRQVCQQIQALSIEDQVATLNRVRAMLHEVSPFADQPVDLVLWIKNELVEGNDYNPNKVAPPEMRLLEISIDEDGYTQPIVTYQAGEKYEVVDGFHRKRVGQESRRVRERVRGYLPVTQIRSGQEEAKNRIAATIRHNRARGEHGVIPMIEIVARLVRRGWTDEEIAKELGMQADEVLRLKQNSGLPELFRDHEYSRAWE